MTIYIRFADGTEMYRNVYRVDVSQDKKDIYIWDTPTTPAPERLPEGAIVSVFVVGEQYHTYRL